MDVLARVIRADCIKLRRTALLRLLLVSPIVVLLVYAGFNVLSTSATGYDPRFVNVMTLYQSITWAFPLLIGCTCSMLAAQERRVSGDLELLAGFAPRWMRLCSKILILSGLGLGGLLVIGMGAYLCMASAGNLLPGLSLRFYVASAGIVLASNAAVFALHLFVGFCCGKLASATLGIIGSVFSVLMWASMGDALIGPCSLWCLVPYAWGARFVSSYAGKLAYDNLTLAEQISCRYGILLCIGTSILSLAALFAWFEQWEGSAQKD